MATLVLHLTTTSTGIYDTICSLNPDPMEAEPTVVNGVQAGGGSSKKDDDGLLS
jgi:hypothetical protein